MLNNITKLSYYACGYCVNNLKAVFKHTPKELRQFAAGVFLLHHRLHGYILFDTGYSLDIYKAGLIGKLYHLLNPTFVTQEDMIDYQLQQEGIQPSVINYIILSHLHPDHVGGLAKFKQAKVIISEKTYINYKNPKLRDLIIPKLIPSWFEDQLIILKDDDLRSCSTSYFSAYDLFSDRSVLITNLDGHAYGQICALINEQMFLGADTCWGADLLDKAKDMKLFARLVQNDYAAYMKSTQVLEHMRKDGIRLWFSHDKYNQKELFTDE
ncbi:MBL fold metallo-hydrolase [Aerococcaceae bacterium NML201209]|nr:MBL fold metallo-hydrolase [Aerococcaceae bacterium NML201209]